jgi:nicotinate-nucleotide--dimethylbenzimidazole phosphoribosyltransferase
VTDLLAVAADVPWTDADAAALTRSRERTGIGRLGDVAEWLASTQGGSPPAAPKRPRLIVIGDVEPAVAARAAAYEVGVRTVAVPDEPAAASAAGAAAADDEIEAGADLVVLATGAGTLAGAAVVGVYTGAEPVALLPRGAEAIDTAAWISDATSLRDTRRRVASLRSRPAELLDALASPAVAAATGCALRTVSRRTPLVLDGSTALAAALLCFAAQPRCGRWWQIADSSIDPVHTRAADHLLQRPLLDLGTSNGDGTAGLLAVEVLRTAAALADLGPRDE